MGRRGMSREGRKVEKGGEKEGVRRRMEEEGGRRKGKREMGEWVGGMGWDGGEREGREEGKK